MWTFRSYLRSRITGLPDTVPNRRAIVTTSTPSSSSSSLDDVDEALLQSKDADDQADDGGTNRRSCPSSRSYSSRGKRAQEQEVPTPKSCIETSLNRRTRKRGRGDSSSCSISPLSVPLLHEEEEEGDDADGDGGNACDQQHQQRRDPFGYRLHGNHNDNDEDSKPRAMSPLHIDDDVPQSPPMRSDSNGYRTKNEGGRGGGGAATIGGGRRSADVAAYHIEQPSPHHNDDNDDAASTSSSGLTHRHHHHRSGLLSSSLFTLLGVGYLLPWNAFLSAADYFHSRLCALPSTNGGGDDDFLATFGFIYNASAVLSLAILTIWSMTGQQRDDEYDGEEEGESTNIVNNSDDDVLVLNLGGCDDDGNRSETVENTSSSSSSSHATSGLMGHAATGPRDDVVCCSRDDNVMMASSLGEWRQVGGDRMASHSSSQWTPPDDECGGDNAGERIAASVAVSAGDGDVDGLSCSHQMAETETGGEASSLDSIRRALHVDVGGTLCQDVHHDGDDDDNEEQVEGKTSHRYRQSTKGMRKASSGGGSLMSPMEMTSSGSDDADADDLIADTDDLIMSRGGMHPSPPSPSYSVVPSPSQRRIRLRAQRQKQQRQHQHRMILDPLLLYLAAFGVMSILTILPQIPPVQFYRWTVACLAVCGACSAIVAAGVLSLANIFPPASGVQSFVSGQAVAGLLVALANVVEVLVREKRGVSSITTATDEGSTAAPPGGPSSCPPYQTDWVAFTYFATGAGVLLLSIVGYVVLHNLPITAFYRERATFLLDRRGSNRGGCGGDGAVSGDDIGGYEGRIDGACESEYATPSKTAPSGYRRLHSGGGGWPPQSEERMQCENELTMSDARRVVFDEEITVDGSDMDMLFEDEFRSRYAPPVTTAFGTKKDASCLGHHHPLETICHHPSSATGLMPHDDSGTSSEESLLEALLGTDEVRHYYTSSATPSDPRRGWGRRDRWTSFMAGTQQEETNHGGRRVDTTTTPSSSSPSSSRKLWSNIRFHVWTSFTVLFVTLSFFPAWTYQIVSVHVLEEEQSPRRGWHGGGGHHNGSEVSLGDFVDTNAGFLVPLTWVSGEQGSANVETPDDWWKGGEGGIIGLESGMATGKSNATLPSMYEDLFFPILFLLFNLFDYLGRLASSKLIPVNRAGRYFAPKLLLASVSRAVVFGPLFFLCSHRQRVVEGGGGTSGATTVSSPLFSSDLYPAILMAAFAFTNGMILTSNLMHVPSVTPRDRQELGATLMTFAISLGLLGGSLASFLVLRVGTGGW